MLLIVNSPKLGKQTRIFWAKKKHARFATEKCSVATLGVQLVERRASRSSECATTVLRCAWGLTAARPVAKGLDQTAYKVEREQKRSVAALGLRKSSVRRPVQVNTRFMLRYKTGRNGGKARCDRTGPKRHTKLSASKNVL